MMTSTTETNRPWKRRRSTRAEAGFSAGRAVAVDETALFKRFMDTEIPKDWLTRTVLDFYHNPAKALQRRHEGISTP